MQVNLLYHNRYVSKTSRKLISQEYSVALIGSDIVGNYWGDSPKSMLPIYQELIAAGLQIWVYRYIFDFKPLDCFVWSELKVNGSNLHSSDLDT